MSGNPYDPNDYFQDDDYNVNHPSPPRTVFNPSRLPEVATTAPDYGAYARVADFTPGDVSVSNYSFPVSESSYYPPPQPFADNAVASVTGAMQSASLYQTGYSQQDYTQQPSYAPQSGPWEAQTSDPGVGSSSRGMVPSSPGADSPNVEAMEATFWLNKGYQVGDAVYPNHFLQADGSLKENNAGPGLWPVIDGLDPSGNQALVRYEGENKRYLGFPNGKRRGYPAKVMDLPPPDKLLYRRRRNGHLVSLYENTDHAPIEASLDGNRMFASSRGAPKNKDWNYDSFTPCPRVTRFEAYTKVERRVPLKRVRWDDDGAEKRHQEIYGRAGRPLGGHQQDTTRRRRNPNYELKGSKSDRDRRDRDRRDRGRGRELRPALPGRSIE